MLLRAEPTKQKTRRPERRGITRAVSPKEIGERKKRMSNSETSNVRTPRRTGQPGSESAIVVALENPRLWGVGSDGGDQFRIAARPEVGETSQYNRVSRYLSRETCLGHSFS